mmetsp:Transcript_58542/g.133780  ORF Transcript_58542/g.133780 Transcript_58542/m.133780 type:complete len:229 (-) Transcript_58542:384-1070(-)
MGHVGPSLWSADGVDEGVVLEALAIRPGHHQLPALAHLRVHVGVCRMKEGRVVRETLDRQLLSIQEHGTTLTAGASHVVDTPAHQRHGVLLQLGHAKLGQVGPELYAGIGLPSVFLDVWLLFPAHVAGPLLRVALAAPSGLHDETGTEDVCELGAETITAACHLLLRVIVIVAGEQMPEHKLWHIYLVLLVNCNRQAFAIVGDFDAFLFRVDLNLDVIHGLVPLQIVS